jgi:hypothetical protein
MSIHLLLAYISLYKRVLETKPLQWQHGLRTPTQIHLQQSRYGNCNSQYGTASGGCSCWKIVLLLSTKGYPGQPDSLSK